MIIMIMVMVVVVVMMMMIVRYVDGGSCILAVHSLSRFQLNKETLWSYGRSVQGAEKYTGRSTVLGVRARQRRHSTHTR
jgi:hypothetical protein